MALATLVERRVGPVAAGWIAGLPPSLAVAVGAISLDAGPDTARAVALSAATHVPAQIAFAVVFAAALTRRGLPAGGVAGCLAYLAASVAVAGVSDALALAVAIPALALAPRLMSAGAPRAGSKRGRLLSAVPCAVPMLIVAATVLINDLAGPAVAGAVAAFPTLSATLAAGTAAKDGAAAGAHALSGLVRSLPCYLTVCLVVATTARSLPLPWSIALALTASVITGHLTWKRIPVAATP
jgi:hypothetical protein